MNRHFIFIAFFSVSMLASAQDLKMGPAAFFPDAWRAGRELVKTISEGVFSREKIQEEAQKKDLSMTSLLGLKKSYLETLLERKARIKATRQEILEARELGSDGSKPREDLEAELSSLLALGRRPEEQSKSASLSFDIQEAERPSLLQKPAQAQDWQVPGMWMAPTGAGSPGSPDTSDGTAASGQSLEVEAQQAFIQQETDQRGPIQSEEARLAAASRQTGNVVRTRAMRADPFARVGAWYSGPREEAQQVGVLEWELGRKDSKRMTLKEAQAYVASKAADGWRLPTIWELEALYRQKDALGHDLVEEWFWSSTPLAGSPTGAWGVDFYYGVVNDYSVTVSIYARCLR